MCSHHASGAAASRIGQRCPKRRRDEGSGELTLSKASEEPERKPGRSRRRVEGEPGQLPGFERRRPKGRRHRTRKRPVLESGRGARAKVREIAFASRTGQRCLERRRDRKLPEGDEAKASKDLESRSEMGSNSRSWSGESVDEMSAAATGFSLRSMNRPGGNVGQVLLESGGGGRKLGTTASRTAQRCTERRRAKVRSGRIQTETPGSKADGAETGREVCRKR